MNEDFATIIVASGMKAAREISGLAPLVKEHCNGDEYERLKLAIGSITYEIMEHLVSRIMEDHPTLKEEVTRRMNKYDRAF